MNCENYLKLIDALIEDELDEQTADKVSLHLVDCEDCTAYFEFLEREKEVYSHYLFEIEPPAHLRNKFEAKLRAEERESAIFAFLRFNPILMTAVLLILFAVGLVLLNLRPETQSVEQANLPRPNLQWAEFSKNSEVEKVTVSETPKPVRAKSGSDLVFSQPKVDGPEIKRISTKQVEEIKTAPTQRTEPKQKSPQLPQVESEEMARLNAMQNLEIESAKQFEKVELLLRSFRNSEPLENGETYDLSSESEQARRLLQTNVALRQKAENFGNAFAKEMLGRVEPYLLEIANLDEKPSSEQVLEIKNRVRNQNIIASLQVF